MSRRRRRADDPAATGRSVRRRTVARTVRNPLTGEQVEVNGPVFRDLTQGQHPPLEYVDDELNFRVNDTFMVVNAVQNPSTLEEERRASGIAIDARQRAILRNIIRRRQTLADLRADAALRASEPFLADNLVEVTYGPYVIRDEDAGPADPTLPTDAQAQPGVQLGNIAVIERFLRQRVLHDKPLRLPFVNVDLNAGPDNRCAERFLGHPLPGQRIQDIINVAKDHSIVLHMFDLMGGTLYATPKEDRPRAPGHITARRAVIFNGHVYPLVDGATPRLITGPKRKLEWHQDIRTTLATYHAAFFQRGRNYLLGSDCADAAGAWAYGDSCWEDWMHPVFEAIPLGLGWDDAVLRMMKAATLSLHYVEDPDTPPTDLVSIDMTKCYYHTMLTLAVEGRLVQSTIFKTWKPWYGSDDDLDYFDYYLLDACHGADLRRFGLLSSVICGEVARLLTANGVTLCISHYMRMQPLPVDVQQGIAEALRTACGDDNTRKKKYALINGMMGRISSETVTQFELGMEHEEERRYYIERYGATQLGSILRIHESTPLPRNRFHVHMHVVQMANYYVLRKAFYVRRRLGVWPVRIKVDSLTYRLSDLRTPWDTTGTARIVKHQDDYWHLEEQRPGAIVARPTDYRKITWPEPSEFDNITYTGAPGTGKTYRALTQHRFDICVCYSNRGARRINGKTVHSAFRIFGDNNNKRNNLNHLRNKLVFVDEAQAAGAALWAEFKRAYIEVGTRFVFAMDVDQLTPVGEAPIDMSAAFLGTVVTLDHDWRNDVSLISARQRVKDGCFTPVVQDVLYAGVLTDLNIAYTNRTCGLVNRLLAKVKGLRFGDDGGKYITLKASKTHGLINAEHLSRIDGKWINGEGKEVAATLKPGQARRSKLIDWAYCTTIHKQIGETFDAPYTIWDIRHRMFDKKLLYTALTRGRTLSQITFRPRPTPEDVKEYLESTSP